jgi:predicted NAD-dependent protein-ADP-ribosyltransferase YbiA (DUF1768 family)
MKRKWDTADAALIAPTAPNRYWADGGNRRGVNRLAQLPVDLRAELRDAVAYSRTH